MRNPAGLSRLFLSLCLLLGLGLSTASAATYHLIQVPGSTLTWPRSINASGQVVGFFQGQTGGFQGFVRRNGKYRSVNYPTAPNTLFSGINNREEISGYYDDGFAIHAFTLAHGNFTVFDYPGATNTYTTGINDKGDVAGFYSAPDGTTHGYSLIAGQFTTIDVPGATETDPSGINDRGLISGSFDDASGQHGLYPECRFVSHD